jgi:hypothetical protein
MDLQTLVPESFRQMMQGSLTIILWLICGALIVQGIDIPEWLIATLALTMGFWFPNSQSENERNV